MTSDQEHQQTLRWKASVEKFERIVVAALALLLVVIVAVTLGVVAYFFVAKTVAILAGIDNIGDLQRSVLRGFSGILLVLLGLELLDTVKVYFSEHSIRVEVILMVGLIAMGRHVLEIDLHEINPLTLFGFATLILVLALSYFLMKRAQLPPLRFGPKHDGETGTAK